MYVDIPGTEKEWEALLDRIYDVGYDDARAGKEPCKDCGDFEDEYMAGYSDGRRDHPHFFGAQFTCQPLT